MKPEQKSQLLLGVARSKAKMIEYGVPEEHHIKIIQDPAKLFTLSIGILGDIGARSNRNNITSDNLRELRESLQFSAHFFDAYLQSKLNHELDPYLILLGSASYFLCDLPGSSKVLAKQIGEDCPNLDGEGLEDLLHWLLRGDLSTYFDGSDGPFGEYIDSISRLLRQFFQDGTGEDNLLALSDSLRQAVYAIGTPRQLLLGDVIAAIVKKKHYNSSWHALPQYSNLTKDQWLSALQRDSFIKELWPAQHLLGQKGVLQGKSAVVQMPTSAGKTRATELIIRSAFLANRTSLAIIVAPFRALCHEIKNSLAAAFQNDSINVDELTDVMQFDFELAELLKSGQVLVVTPEKFLYALRHTPELADNVGLLIFDEGHQFDSGTRGIIYELLVTSLRSLIPNEAQKVLISAVISNAEDIGKWLNGPESEKVVGTNLTPTFRSVGFASWLDPLGRIEYASNKDTEKREFFVPRVIESYELQRKKGESKTKIRVFPDKANVKDVGKEIAFYLGLKLMSQGAVAIFCGRKDTASGLCEMIVERFSRNLPLAKPIKYSDSEEILKLHYLHLLNLGPEAAATQSAQFGIFSHHGNTPHGVRLAVEHAMREGLIRFVVCTSTLAQGVNLPIRYLIVTSIYQGKERIKVRDFHNLIGRAGRAGMHTEGSILFVDPVVYDKRDDRNENWRWTQVKELLKPGNSEPCVSNLLSLFEPIKSDDGKSRIIMEAMDFAKEYINNPGEIAKLSQEIATRHKDKNFSKDGVERQITWKINLMSAIESFLMANWEPKIDSIAEEEVISLAEQTLAYFLADAEKRGHIRELFRLLAENIAVKVSDPKRRRAYGRTLYGLREAQEIDAWTQANINPLSTSSTDDEMLDIVWPVLVQHIHNGVFNKFDKPAALKEVAIEWIQGKPFHELFDTLQRGDAKLIWGTKRRQFKIEHVVEICENGLAYDGTLLIGAIIEFIDMLEQVEMKGLIKRLQLFQKRLKYGLPSEASIALYELGFSDRVIAQDLSQFNSRDTNKKTIKSKLRRRNSIVREALQKYPSYFTSEILDGVIRSSRR